MIKRSKKVQLLKELIKEQVKNENSGNTTRSDWVTSI